MYGCSCVEDRGSYCEECRERQRRYWEEEAKRKRVELNERISSDYLEELVLHGPLWFAITYAKYDADRVLAEAWDACGGYSSLLDILREHDLDLHDEICDELDSDNAFGNAYERRPLPPLSGRVICGLIRERCAVPTLERLSKRLGLRLSP